MHEVCLVAVRQRVHGLHKQQWQGKRVVDNVTERTVKSEQLHVVRTSQQLYGREQRVKQGISKSQAMCFRYTITLTQRGQETWETHNFKKHMLLV